MKHKHCDRSGFCSNESHWEFCRFFISDELEFVEHWNCVVCEESIFLPAPMKYFDYWKAKMKLEDPEYYEENYLQYTHPCSSKKGLELQANADILGHLADVVSTLEDCSWSTRTGYIQLTKDFKRPSIKQYKKGVKPSQRNRMTSSLRLAILERDRFSCCYCGRNAYDGVKLHVDHIVPVSKGGKTVKGNLQTLCVECNQGKSNKLIKKP